MSSAIITCELDQEELEGLLFEGKPVEFFFEDDHVTVRVVKMSVEKMEEE